MLVLQFTSSAWYHDFSDHLLNQPSSTVFESLIEIYPNKLIVHYVDVDKKNIDTS
jgi:hypothetical protein